jgi:hypothetical protein
MAGHSRSKNGVASLAYVPTLRCHCERSEAISALLLPCRQWPELRRLFSSVCFLRFSCLLNSKITLFPLFRGHLSQFQRLERHSILLLCAKHNTDSAVGWAKARLRAVPTRGLRCHCERSEAISALLPVIARSAATKQSRSATNRPEIASACFARLAMTADAWDIGERSDRPRNRGILTRR